MSEPDETSPYVAALLRERDALARYGKTDRVADVDAELARVGYRPTERHAPPVETTAPPRRRPKREAP